MTDPTPTRAEVAVCYACGALPCDQAHTPKPHIQHTDDINDMVLLGMARDELFAENQALRERAEAAEKECEVRLENELNIAEHLLLSRRAEAAAWNDAIEAAAQRVGDLCKFDGRKCDAAAIRAIRRAAPTEGEA